ncbi:MAG: RHS repeat-associated core domain-containing protein [Geminicoccaceae bacterium]
MVTPFSAYGMDAATPTPGESLCRPLPRTGHGWQPGRTATASTTPFGELASPKGNLTQNLLLSGQFSDIETGLYQNWWRDYDPALGRYIQADPIGLAGGANVYGYVEGNPASKIDLLGLFKICCRPLSGLPFMGPQLGADPGIYHEHGFFEDEKGGNIGFGPDGLFAKGNKNTLLRTLVATKGGKSAATGVPGFVPKWRCIAPLGFESSTPTIELQQ